MAELQTSIHFLMGSFPLRKFLTQVLPSMISSKERDSANAHEKSNCLFNDKSNPA